MTLANVAVIISGQKQAGVSSSWRDESTSCLGAGPAFVLWLCHSVQIMLQHQPWTVQSAPWTFLARQALHHRHVSHIGVTPAQ